MKKLIFLFSLFSIFLVNNGFAANYRVSPYVGVDLGTNITSDTSIAGINLGGTFHTNYGAEVSYINYGLGLDTSGFAIDAIGYFPTRHIIALAALGYGMQINTTDPNNTAMYSGPRIAGGVQYRFTRVLSGRALLRYSMLSEISNQIDANFGLSYSF